MRLEEWCGLPPVLVWLWYSVQDYITTDSSATLSFKLDWDHLMNQHQADSDWVSLLMDLNIISSMHNTPIRRTFCNALVTNVTIKTSLSWNRTAQLLSAEPFNSSCWVAALPSEISNVILTRDHHDIYLKIRVESFIASAHLRGSRDVFSVLLILFLML